MTDRPNCRQPAICKAKTAGKHCAPCSLASKWADPKFRQKRADAYRARFKDPKFKAKHCAASSERLATWRRHPDSKPGADARSRANLALANSPEAISRRTDAIRRHRVGWCPPERLEDYYYLRRRVGAAEARRMMEVELGRDLEISKARDAIAEFDRQQRERHARELAQAY